MTACWADMAARDYADREGREAEFEAAVDSRAKELMAPGEDCDPLRADNFEEAISESLVDVLGGMPATLVKLLATEQGPYVIARVLLAVATKYMKPAAELRAEELLLEGEAA